MHAMQFHPEDGTHARLHTLRVELLHAIHAAEDALHPEPISNAEERTHVAGIGNAIEREHQLIGIQGCEVQPIGALHHSHHFVAVLQGAHTLQIIVRPDVQVRVPHLRRNRDRGMDGFHRPTTGEQLGHELHALHEEHALLFAVLLLVECPHPLQFGLVAHLTDIFGTARWR